MTTRNRMKRQWLHFNSGADPIALGTGSQVRVLIRSLAEIDLARSLDNWTVTRVIFNLYLVATGGVVRATVQTGLIVLNENIGLSTIGPIANPHNDWFYHEGFVIDADLQMRAGNIERDVAGRRRASGLERGLFYYIENRSATSTVNFSISGRALILEH